MFRVLPFVRVCFGVMCTALLVLLYFLKTEEILFMLTAVAVIWFQFYLSELKIYFEEGKLIKHTGKIFNRRYIIVLKNICGANVLSLHNELPAVIRIMWPHRDIFIIGFNGRQAGIIERMIMSSV